MNPADLLDHLPTGYDNAKPSYWLAHELSQDWSKPAVSERAIGMAVAQLRREGHLIGSSCGAKAGYFIATTPEDVERGLGHITRRAAESLAVVRAMRRSAEAAFGPQTASLFDVEGVA